MNPTAVDEEDFRDFPSLPSHLNTTGFLTTAGGGSTLRSESEGMQAQSYGTHERGKNDMEADSGYNDLFGEETPTPALPFHKPDLQTMESLGHEPLFPDVDEEKIEPTVGLAANVNATNHRVSPPQKEEFTIVLDPSSSDPRYTAPGNVPVADWVVPPVPNRREPMLVRQTATSHHGAPSMPRQGGLHPSAPSTHGPMHGRNVTGPSTGARAVRIPPGCNPDLEPEFPTRAAPDQALKLPGQTRVTPDEYKEFLGLGHGEIFNLDLDRVVDPPWRAPGADTTDFFNYGLDETSWKEYCKAIECHRQEFSMKKKIQTYESSNVGYHQDPDLPPEVAAAIAAESYHARPGAGPDVTKALPIPVFQGADDYSLRNRRGRDFRRPEVRYDPEVILELAGGIEPSTGVNADYGEDYVGSFGPGDLKSQDSRPPDKSGHENTPTAYAPTVPKTEEGSALSKTTEENDSIKVAAKNEAAAMFKDDDDFEDHQRSKTEMVRPGELAMGMETDPQQTSAPWPAQKMSYPGASAPPYPDVGRMYDPYAPPHDPWRPFYQGRGWRPRGPPEYWPAGRGYGRSHPDGGRGGRYWHGYGGPRRPGRRPPLPRYYDDYRPTQYPQWTRREDRPPPLVPEHHVEKVKSSGYPEHLMHETFSSGEQGPPSYRDRDRRRHSVEREEERPRSHPRLRSRDYEGDPRSFSHHRDRSREFGRNHRRDDYDDRRDRERRRRDRSAERDMRRRGYSKDRSRGRDREERRSRRYATSDSESESRYRTRSKDRD